ncbi:MAG: hypothetical protein ABIK86_02035 [candidate division WOR-3 bacterium]
MLRSSAVLVAALAIAPQLLAWTAPERVDRRPEGYRAYLPAVAEDPSGGVHVVWSESKDPPGFQDKIMYARKMDDTWSVPVFISRDSGDIRESRMVSDETGTLFVVWSDDGAVQLRYVRLLGDTWSVPRLVTTQPGVVPRLALDSAGQIHLLFGEPGGGNIWHTSYIPPGDSWAVPAIIASGDLGWHEVAADDRGRLHATWMDNDTRGLGYSFYVGTRWSDPIALPDPYPDCQSCDPDLAVDSLGSPHVVWTERVFTYYVYYARFTGDSWTTPVRLYEDYGDRPEIEPDAAGRMVVVWGWDTGLKFVVQSDTGWSDPETITSEWAFPAQMIPGRANLHLVLWLAPWRIGYSQHPAQGACEEPNPSGLSPMIASRGPSLVVTLPVARAEVCAASVVDAGGRVVRSIQLGILTPGRHELRLCDSLVPGVYFCQISLGNERLTVKSVIVK